jgi:TRAP-type C4-dicarboxylate transport system substrate-binding protein
MFKKFFLTFLLIVLVSAVDSAYCAEPIKPIELKCADWNPPISAVAKIHQRWADMIEQKSGGRLKIKLYFSESLAKSTEVLKATQTGVADLTYYVVGTDRHITPLSMVTRLPFLGMPSMSVATSIWMELYNKFPEIQKEWRGVRIVSPASLPADFMHFTKKDIRVPSDIKGLRVICRGEWPTVLKNLGAGPVEMPIGEWYMSLERGVADGIITHFPVTYTTKILELLKHHTMLSEGTVSIAMSLFLMNLDVWNKLPRDLQKIVEEAGVWQREEIIKSDEGEQERIINQAKTTMGHTFSYLKPEEDQLWIKLGGIPIYEKWIADNEANGPAKKIFEETKRLLKQNVK